MDTETGIETLSPSEIITMWNRIEEITENSPDKLLSTINELIKSTPIEKRPELAKELYGAYTTSEAFTASMVAKKMTDATTTTSAPDKSSV